MFRFIDFAPLKFIILACLMLLASEKAEAKITNCKISYQDELAELNNALWAPVGKSRSGRVIFVLGAPWCPHCRRLYKMATQNRYDIEFRFLPIDAASLRHYQQLYDMGINGRSGLDRVYGRKEAKAVAADERFTRVIDALDMTKFIFRLRYEVLVKKYYGSKGRWGSPMNLVPLEKAVLPFPGYPKYENLQKEADVITSYRQHKRSQQARSLLLDMPKMEAVNAKMAFAQKNDTRIFAVPLDGTPSMCTQRGDGFPVLGKVNIAGEDWLVLHTFKAKPLRGGRARDVRAYTRARNFEMQ